MTDLVAEMAERLFGGAGKTEDGGDEAFRRLWREIEEAGLPFALLSEQQGGFGLSPEEAFQPPSAAAKHAVSVPLAETMLANFVLAGIGGEPRNEPACIVLGPEVRGDLLVGSAHRVPFGRHLQTVAVLLSDGRLVLPSHGWIVTPGANLASEPRDTLQFSVPLADCAVIASKLDRETVEGLGAAARTVAIAGAAEATLALSIGYANDRAQFGRPIAKFQAIQHNLAVMAGQVAAARAAADIAAAAVPHVLTSPAKFRLDAGIAKCRASEAAGLCASIAHQVHGAIGFTREYALHRLTRRLWSWRDEYGSDALWSERIGQAVLGAETDELWPLLTNAEFI